MLPVLTVIFALIITAVGGERGVKTMFCILVDFIIMAAGIFLMLKNVPVILITMLMGLLMCAMNLFYQNGYQKKTIAAFQTVMAITVGVSVISLLICWKGKIGGYDELKLFEDDACFLSADIHIPMVYVEIAVIIFSLLGAVIDISVAVTSAVYEVQKNTRLTSSELFRSGMKMGREMLATQMNTLFFACIAESLLLFDMMRHFQYSFAKMLNSQSFAQVFLGTTMGAVGCMIAIPLSTYMMTKNIDAEPALK